MEEEAGTGSAGTGGSVGGGGVGVLAPHLRPRPPPLRRHLPWIPLDAILPKLVHYSHKSFTCFMPSTLIRTYSDSYYLVYLLNQLYDHYEFMDKVVSHPIVIHDSKALETCCKKDVTNEPNFAFLLGRSRTEWNA